MADAVFDGPNKIIQIPSIGTFSAGRDLYSAWKRWFRLSDNAKFDLAFDTTGGDNIGGGQEIAPYFFLRNDLGWRIRPAESNGETVVQGNLFPRDPLQSTFVAVTGFDAFVRLEVSTRAVVVTVPTGGALTATQDTRLTELHQLRGLDASNPVTVTETQESSGDITLNITGNGTTTSTLTRQ